MNEYSEHESIPVFVNSMTSSKTQIPLDYYSLPVCKPEKIVQQTMNIGNALSGEEYSNTPLSFKMLENVLYPQKICSVKLTEEDVKVLKARIEEEYEVQWIIDDFPAASVSVSEDGEGLVFDDTHPLGLNVGGSHVLFNHLAFTIDYHKNSDKYTIVGVRVSSSSVDYIEYKDKLIARTKQGHATVDTPHEIIFSYSVKFEESAIPYGSRWDIYLYNNEDKGVHWFSLTNSLLMALLLSAVVGVIILRTLSRDINRYNSITEEERLDAVEDSGWKLIHGDVFRPPTHPDLFASVIGTGVQVFWTLTMVIVLAALGILSPVHRGSLLTAAVILFFFMAFLAGFSSARLNQYFGGKHYTYVIMLVSCLLPGILMVITSCMNILWYILKSPQFIHFTSVLKLAGLWFAISIPLAFLGSFVAYKLPKYHMPVRTNHIERQIPPQPWYLHPALTCLVGSCVPFGTIFLEIYFMMSSVLLHQIYAVFGFLLVIFFLMIVTTAEIAIVICYFRLAHEDYKWWWSSFTDTACTGLFIFLFAVYYMIRLGINKPVSVILYLCLMVMICGCFSLACGTVSFYSCLFFTKKIYGSLKVD